MCKELHNTADDPTKPFLSAVEALAEDLLFTLAGGCSMRITVSVKTALFLGFCLASATGAMGQYAASAGYAPMATTFTPVDHTMHASSMPLATAQSLFQGSGDTVAQGEMPLWEAVPERREIPLGDAARELKKEHANVKKARKVWEN